jgi:hypothetical protein
VSNSNLAFWFVDQRSISMEILLATTHCDIAFRYSMNADALVVRYIFGMLLYSADLICATNASIAAIRLPTPDVAVAGSVAATTAPTASTTGTAAVTSDSTLETTSDTVSDITALLPLTGIYTSVYLAPLKQKERRLLVALGMLLFVLAYRTLRKYRYAFRIMQNSPNGDITIFLAKICMK